MTYIHIPPPTPLSIYCLHCAHPGKASAPQNAATGARRAQLSSAPAAAGRPPQPPQTPPRGVEGTPTASRSLFQPALPAGRARVTAAAPSRTGKVPAQPRGPPHPSPYGLVSPPAPARARLGPPGSPRPPSSAGCRCWNPAMSTWRPAPLRSPQPPEAATPLRLLPGRRREPEVTPLPPAKTIEGRR